MKKWFISNKAADFQHITEKFKVSEIIARVMVNRGVKEDNDIEEYLNGTINDMHDPLLMKDMDKARDIIIEKANEKKRIRIVGDYDVDGIVSTFVLYDALKNIGACVDYCVPDRIKDGYGINKDIIKRAYDDGIDTILTCDNGIAALEQAEYAWELGMTMVITDHHDVPFEENDGVKRQILPKAKAVVNPHRDDCAYPYKNLCGASVSYKLVEAIYKKLGFKKEDVTKYIEYIAIATVCDVMELKKENRIIVKHGLYALINTSNKGLRALYVVNNLTSLNVFHLGFVIGPCLNATGRLSSATRAIELLSCDDEKKAISIATELKELNDSRKDMTKENFEKALQMIEESDMIYDKIIVVYLKDCHESLAGIIAGRIREKYYKPAIVLTEGEGIVKGSCRSIEQYNIFEELTRCKDLLTKFGGHPMAAGLSLPMENVELLRRRLNDNTTLTEEDLIPKVSIDIALPFGYVNEDVINELEKLEPCGKDNEKPIFAERNVTVSKAKVFGKNRNVLKCSLTNEYGRTMEGIYFGDIEEFETYITDKFGSEELNKLYNGFNNVIKLSIIYYPVINEFNGRRTVQIQIKEYR